MHSPCSHDASLSQPLPQPPQLARSVAVSTQPLPQSICPSGHAGTAVDASGISVDSTGFVAAAHAPFVQLPPLHTLPQPPQLFGSDVGSTQTPLQLVAPFGQPMVTVAALWTVASWQTPFAHVPPAGHAVPHAPQFAGSALVSAQVPLQRV